MVQLCQDVINLIMNYKAIIEEDDVLSIQVLRILQLVGRKASRQIRQGKQMSKKELIQFIKTKMDRHSMLELIENFYHLSNIAHYGKVEKDIRKMDWNDVLESKLFSTSHILIKERDENFVCYDEIEDKFRNKLLEKQNYILDNLSNYRNTSVIFNLKIETRCGNTEGNIKTEEVKNEAIFLLGDDYPKIYCDVVEKLITKFITLMNKNFSSTFEYRIDEFEVSESLLRDEQYFNTRFRKNL